MKTNLLIVSFLVSIHSYAVTFAYGAYTGDGNATKTISGLPFDPEAILVKGVGAYAAWIATNDMPAGKAKNLATSAALEANLISSFGSTQFVVGNAAEANTNGVLYHFIAFDQSTELNIGSYTGTGGTVTNNGLNTSGSEIVWIFPDAAEPSSFFVSDRGNISGSWITCSNDNQTYVWSTSATGFTCGTGASTNAVNYYFIAMDDNDADIEDFAFAGTAADNNALTSFGFSPEIAFSFSYGGNGAVSFKTTAMTSTNAFKITATGVETDLIKSLDSEGVTLGSDVAVNPNVGGSWNSIVAFNGGTSLPVELTSFTAKKDKDKVKISWETAGEINSDYYEVERSVDGNNFEILQKVYGAGQSNELLYYSVHDEHPNAGSNYYRLKQVDFNGAFEYFKTVVVNFSTSNYLPASVFPSLTDGDNTVSFEAIQDENYTVYIYNENGMAVFQTIVKAKKGNNQIVIPANQFASGNYLIKLFNEQYQTSLKFSKF